MKKLKSLFAIMMIACMMTGCGNGDTNADTNSDAQAEEPVEIIAEDYVTLGEYKGIEVSTVQIAVSDAETESLMNELYKRYITAENGGIVDRAVAVGDTVNIDFKGMKDGVAFEGGTAEGYELGIGSGSFIDGFEDGLVDVMPGETVDLDLAFPTDYHNEELKGQPVVFTVTVNYIYPTTIEEDVVANMGMPGVSTIEELREYAYNYLYEQEEREHSNDAENSVVATFIENCTFKELPQSLVDEYNDMAIISLMEESSYYGMDVDRYVNLCYGITYDEFLAQYGPSAARQDLAFNALANKENLVMTDEELEAELETFAQNNGYVTVEEFLGGNSREMYREYFLFERVINFLMENAVVTETAAE